MRKAGDMFKKVARGDFRNMPYLSKHFLEAERLREKGRTPPPLGRRSPYPEAVGHAELGQGHSTLKGQARCLF